MSIFLRIWHIAEFFVFYLRELIVANCLVAYDALTPTLQAKPAILGIRTKAETDLELLLLANLITMTPGTITLDISTDRKVIYIHAMFADDPEKLRREIQENFEPRILRLCR